MDISDETLMSRIAEKVKGGIPPETAAQVCGLRLHVFRAWMEKGKEEETGSYSDFYDRISTANAMNVETVTKRFKDATEFDWKAALSWLERVDPENWSKPEHRFKVNPRLDEIKITPVLEILQRPAARDNLRQLLSGLNIVEGDYKEIDDDNSGTSEEHQT